MIACALTAKKSIKIDNINPKLVKNEIETLKKIGVKIKKKNLQLS